MANVRGEELSMIFQEPMTSLNPVMKVGKQVQEVILLHRKISKKEAKDEVLRIFEKVGISEPEKRYGLYTSSFVKKLHIKLRREEKCTYSRY